MGANNVSAAADVDHNRCEINSSCKIIAVLRFAGVFATTSNIYFFLFCFFTLLIRVHGSGI
jgi:hypothetical protein